MVWMNKDVGKRLIVGPSSRHRAFTIDPDSHQPNVLGIAFGRSPPIKIANGAVMGTALIGCYLDQKRAHEHIVVLPGERSRNDRHYRKSSQASRQRLFERRMIAGAGLRGKPAHFELPAEEFREPFCFRLR